ncbi:hypothetical protein PUN28_014716 [Cardiocondyla obscurior]|uniref:Uncharacterized protein n=1 Tax=Cardiocondyla obscurior TaxID=286306 RepID=A0AAW2EWV6_9HYME
MKPRSILSLRNDRESAVQSVLEVHARPWVSGVTERTVRSRRSTISHRPARSVEESVRHSQTTGLPWPFVRSKGRSRAVSSSASTRQSHAADDVHPRQSTATESLVHS